MKSIEILALAIRLIGIVFILDVVQFFAYSYTTTQQWMYGNPGESAAMWLAFYGVIGFILVAACFFLIKFPMTVSRWLLPKSEGDEPIFNGSIDDLRIAAFTIIGVYILSWAIPDFFYNAGMLLHMRSQGMMDLYNEDAKDEYIIQELTTVLEIGVGLYLCLQAKGLNAMLLKFRRMGAE